MAFRGKEMMKKILKTVGENGLSRRDKESLEKCIPKNKIVMNRAKRVLFAERHIQFGNRVSEDGCNNELVTSSYRHLINGFAVHFSSEQASTLRRAFGVKSVERDWK